MPDFNPDKEAHRDHKWIVHKAIKGNPAFDRVKIDGKEMPFNREGRFSVSDEKVANEIREAYPRLATVSRVSTYHPSDRGHKYFFSCPAMPWHEQEDK